MPLRETKSIRLFRTAQGKGPRLQTPVNCLPGAGTPHCSSKGKNHTRPRTLLAEMPGISMLVNCGDQDTTQRQSATALETGTTWHRLEEASARHWPLCCLIDWWHSADSAIPS